MRSANVRHQHAGRNTEAATVMNLFLRGGGIPRSVADVNFLRLYLGGPIDLAKVLIKVFHINLCVCKFMVCKSALLRLLIKYPNVFYVSFNGQKMTFAQTDFTVQCYAFFI